MPTFEAKAWLALRTRLTSLALTPVLPIAWPNEVFTPPAGGYLRVTYAPNVVVRQYTNSRVSYRPGIFLVNVVSKLNQNMAVAIEIAGKVAAHFPQDLRMSYQDVTLYVEKEPDVRQPLITESFVEVPVVVWYAAVA